MTENRRKKNSRQRGSHTHGWGSMKKHRGSGNRGGTGLAGSGKRADSKKPSLWKERWFGKRGFVSRKKKTERTINLWALQERMPALIKEKKAKEEAGAYSIDLGTIGINKLLGTGKISSKMKIAVKSASKGAKEAVEKAGGAVITEEKKEAKKEETKKEAKEKSGKDGNI
ncbi:uL15 family ribosomal protein [Candidatus Woesearchaeota archaeon]|nr:uL15 family ribosomal protein [Candidatus Woesearchaeota archaeon]